MHLSFIIQFNSYIVYYDYAAISIFLILLLCIYLRHLNKVKSSKYFFILLFIAILASLFEILSAQILNQNILNDNIAISYMMFSLNYIFKISVFLFFSVYLLTFTKTIDYFKGKIIPNALLYTPYIIMVFMLIFNYSTNVIYKLDIINNEIEFYKSNTYFIFYLLEGYYLFIILTIVIKNIKLLTKFQILSFLLIIPISILVMILKANAPFILIEMLLISFALIMVVEYVETPELLIDNRTGLRNIKMFEFEIKRSFLFKNNLYVLLINITNFNKLYSLFDYDLALNYVKEISNIINNYDKKSRSYSLDEGLFSIIFNDKHDALKATKDIKKILSNINKLDFVPEESICLINIPYDFDNLKQFMTFTRNFHDENKGEVVLFNEIKDKKDFIISNNIETIIEDALKHSRFNVYYQPIFNVKENRFTSAEALVRINDPRYGIIMPNMFVNRAEMNGTISNIDLYVTESVMRLIKNRSIDSLGIETISINLSLQDFNTSNFSDKIIELKNLYDIDSKMIKFEITERNDVLFNDKLFINIKKLIDEGFEFMLDDYGTGYSNLERFAKLPIDYVKIDKELVTLSKVSGMKDVLNATFKMIHELNRKSVVEGIENEIDYNDFIKYECNYVQGYYFTKALEENDFIDYLKNSNTIN